MWLLLRSNLKGRMAYNAIIVSAVALALTVVLTAIIMTRSVQTELVHKQLLLGPELAVVPPGTKQIGHIYLTKGPPTHGFIPRQVLDAAKSFPEVAVASVQKFLGRVPAGQGQAMFIAFDPATDFMLQPWREAKGPAGSVVVGGLVLGSELLHEKTLGQPLELQGKTYTVAARLRPSGTFMDRALFLAAPAEMLQDEVSWVLLSLLPGTSMDVMINKLETNIAQVEVISRPEMLKTIDGQLQGIISGGGLDTTAVLVAVCALLVVGGMFALSVYERRREFGLLKAMGAKNSFVFRLIIGEAVALGALGGGAGLIFSAIWITLTGVSLFATGISPLSGVLLVAGKAAVVLLLTVGVGVATALFPALMAARLEPYAAIRSGE